MNKRYFCKYKISRLYAEDIFGIFFKKQKRRVYLFKKLFFCFFIEQYILQEPIKNVRNTFKRFNKKTSEDRIRVLKYLKWYKKEFIFLMREKHDLLMLNFWTSFLKKENNTNILHLSKTSKTEFFLSLYWGGKLIKEQLKIFRHNKSLRERESKHPYIKRPYFLIYSLNKIKGVGKTILKFYKINKFKSVYHTQILKVWKLRKFYGNLSKYELKTLCNSVINKRGNILIQFIIALESRIDTVLFRSNFVVSIFEARHWIAHNRVIVNKQLINKKSYTLKLHEQLSLTPYWKKKVFFRTLNDIFFEHYWQLPVYLEINYKSFNILFLYDMIKPKELYYNFQFTGKDVNSVLYYYY
jgi:ribosomal protein S4